MKKKILIILLIFISLINIYNISFAEENLTLITNDNSSNILNITNNTISDVPEPNFQIYSEGPILIDSKTGNILAQKEMDKQLYPASITKVLNAIIAIEKLNLDSFYKYCINDFRIKFMLIKLFKINKNLTKKYLKNC